MLGNFEEQITAVVKKAGNLWNLVLPRTEEPNSSRKTKFSTQNQTPSMGGCTKDP